MAITVKRKRGQAPPFRRDSILPAVPVARWEGDIVQETEDALVVEEPLEIRIAGCRVAVTMRTPGDDIDLVLGFLFTEGILQTLDEVHSVKPCSADQRETEGNIINVNPVHPDLVDPERWQRNFYTTSSCGVCGKASIESVRQEAAPIQSACRVTTSALYQMEGAMRGGQGVFARTGGLHAAALFTVQGEPANGTGAAPLAIREDVGRHNAVDKVIGDAFRRGVLPLNDHVLVVSGRTSFEIVQKALMAGIPVVASVSAPSSLAVDLARSGGMTLAGFLRTGSGAGRFNVYAGEERIIAG